LPPPYEGRRAALATRHGKERAIAPAFARLTGLSLVVPPDLDTDALGTFTGEVPRPAPMAETARMKARMGMAATGLPLGIASEGSFGPHPAIPFIAAAREMLVFVDAEQGIEIVETEISEDTNFAALDLAPGADLDGFLARVGFPDHAVVLRAESGITKAIASRQSLERAIARAAAPLRIETDMRAHLNPTRMAMIARLAERLARRIATPCPACAAPGFGVVRAEAGLPCEDCGAETSLIRARISACARCAHGERGPRGDGRRTASPAECPYCNP